MDIVSSPELIVKIPYSSNINIQEIGLNLGSPRNTKEVQTNGEANYENFD